jgi:hypothetical protein
LLRKQEHHRSVSEIVRPKPFVSNDNYVSSRDVSAVLKEDSILYPVNKPQLPAKNNYFPSQASFSMASLLPRSVIDKELPALPRRPVGGYQSDTERNMAKFSNARPYATKDDIEVGRQTSSKWSLFPKSGIAGASRPATSNGYRSSNQKNPTQTPAALFENPSPEPNPRPTLRRAATESQLRIDQAQPEIEPLPEATNDRLGRLRRSLSVLGNMKKKHSSQPTGLRRKWSILYLSSKFKPNSTDKQNTFLEEDTDNLDSNDGHMSTTLDPVGIYDPVSKMWLIPPKSRTTSFGIYDPDSQQWLAPSPRIDSYRKVENVGDGELKERGAVLKRDDVDEDEEHGALSLAEKLEMIRYNPMTRTFSTPTTTLHNRPSTSNSANEPPRPWKAGKILGLAAPPIDNFASDLPVGDTLIFPERMKHPVARSLTEESGSGYLSFESHEENTRRDWKGIWKNVQFKKRIKRTSNLTSRRSAVGA